MFVLDPAPTFAASVAIRRLDATEPVQLPCTFKHRPVSQLIELQRRLQADNLTDVDVLHEVLADLEVYAPDGQRVPYSRDVLVQLLDAYPYAGPAIFQGYKDALQQGRLGN